MELMKLRQAGFSWEEISILYGGIKIRVLKTYLEYFMDEEKGLE